MSLSTRRSLAMMAAEDGELQQADDALTALIDGLALDGGEPADLRQLSEACRCLLNRAAVRSWAVRPAEALQDLAQAEALAEPLKPLQRSGVLINLLDARARLLAAPHTPVHDPAAAQAAASAMRAVA
ncbi:hypothetical protein, partial [Ideonella sp.]|uniref:hypothetical protein n=1 Tax=Ideonella sp. TaxID=1929293 RepID=UPI003BB5B2FC